MVDEQKSEAVTKVEVGDSVFEFQSVNEEYLKYETIFKSLKVDGIGQFSCKFCGKEFQQKQNVLTHIKSLHTFKLSTCSICEKTFDRTKQLRNHIAAVHKTKKCPTCNQTFKLGGYRVHLIKCKTLSCSFCDFETNIKKLLTEHKYKNHKNQIHNYRKEKHYCKVCNYSSYRQKSVSKHAYSVHVAKIECDICGKGISNWVSLETHKEKLHSKWKCDICGKYLLRKGSLERHLKYYHTKIDKEVTKSETYYKCGHCPYKSRRKWTLKRHFEKHLKPKPVPVTEITTCDICNFTFTRNSNLKTHLKRGCPGGIIVGF